MYVSTSLFSPLWRFVNAVAPRSPASSLPVSNAQTSVFSYLIPLSFRHLSADTATNTPVRLSFAPGDSTLKLQTKKSPMYATTVHAAKITLQSGVTPFAILIEKMTIDASAHSKSTASTPTMTSCLIFISVHSYALSVWPLMMIRRFTSPVGLYFAYTLHDVVSGKNLSMNGT